MRCQWCGFEITNPNAIICPNCGSTLTSAAADQGSGQGSGQGGWQGLPPAPEPPASAAPPPPPPAYMAPPPPVPPFPGGDQPNVPSPPVPPVFPYPVTGQPDVPVAPPVMPAAPEWGTMPGTMPGSMPSGTPVAPAPAMPPTEPGMPPYAVPAPPSMPYGAPAYGQPGAPGMPPSMPPGYAPPPGYGQPVAPGYPYAAPPTYPLPGYGALPSMPFGAPYPGYPGGPPPGPPPAPPKRRVGLIVGVSLASVLILLVVAAGALYAFVPQVRTLVTGASPTATATVVVAPSATATPAATVLYQNSFASAASDWSNDTHCFLGTGGYHVKDGYICYAPIGVQTDVDVKVDVKQINGPTNQPFGISVRLNDSTGARYDFDLDAIGHWVAFRCDGTNCTRLVDYTASASIHGGLNTSNTLEVKVKGTHFVFSANGTQIGQVDDTTYASGLVGLSGADTGEIVFSNLTIAQPR